jgi:Mn2+/Fe2+ NRAMP family transporter
LEKGYARYTGKADSSKEWTNRALGWMRVLRWDVWCSMIVYTTATLAFYLLGAAILGRSGMTPKDEELIRTLNVMYEPVFGTSAKVLFLLGAFAVLYSTFFVASAGNARICADALGVIGLAKRDPAAVRHRVIWLSGLFPLLSMVLFLLMPKQPQNLVFFSGAMQALMLPMLAIAALYFRYHRCDPRVKPGKLWDVCLWSTSAIMLVISICMVAVKVMNQYGYK